MSDSQKKQYEDEMTAAGWVLYRHIQRPATAEPIWVREDYPRFMWYYTILDEWKINGVPEPVAGAPAVIADAFIEDMIAQGWGVLRGDDMEKIFVRHHAKTYIRYGDGLTEYNDSVDDKGFKTVVPF